MKKATKRIDAVAVTAQDLPAGGFSAWLQRIRAALPTNADVDVPCGACTACCRSSQFIHIRPDETDTLSRIAPALLFAAPGLPAGNVLMGYDRHGHCPMLIDDQCSIYAHRPQTCRHYDCRIFAAAGIAAGGADKALITQRAQRWQFSYPSARDRAQHAAVQAAAAFLRDSAASFPNGAPTNATQIAVVAVKVCEVFLDADRAAGAASQQRPDQETANAIIAANEHFDAGTDKPAS